MFMTVHGLISVTAVLLLSGTVISNFNKSTFLETMLPRAILFQCVVSQMSLWGVFV